MMSALGGGAAAGGGGTQKADDSTNKLRECDSDKGGGRVKNSRNFADVI